MNQSNAKLRRDERVYQVEDHGSYRPLVPVTTRTSGQRLMAQLVEENRLSGLDRYKMFNFSHPNLERGRR